MSLMFKHPFTSISAGPTGCSEIHFVNFFLKYLPYVCNLTFDHTVLHYWEWQPGYRQLGIGIEFRERLPQTSDYLDKGKKSIISDDLMCVSHQIIAFSIYIQK